MKNNIKYSIIKSIINRLILLFLIFLGGCQTFSDVGDNIAKNFSTPQKTAYNVKNPVKSGVRLSALWIGHASVLLQIYDKVIITDPLLTYNVAGILRRNYQPGIDINNLKQCDIVLISHSHSDHLSLGSLGKIESKFPEMDLVFPEGVEEYLPDYSFNLHRLKMPSEEKNEYLGESVVLDSVKITCLTSRHWGGRNGIDGKLWTDQGFCAFIVQYRDVCVYISGDSSYDPDLFEFIRNNYKIDLAVINIIYCDDCEDINQSKSHLYPMGAVKILEVTGAEYMIPVHFGTFTDVNAQIPVLKKLMLQDKNLSGRIKILNLGEQVIF